MPFRIRFTDGAAAAIHQMEGNPSDARKLRRIRKAIAQLEQNPRHPGLSTHRYQSKQGPGGEPLWEAYVENRTPGAWRIWFWYGPDRETISILTIGPHPD